MPMAIVEKKYGRSMKLRVRLEHDEPASNQKREITISPPQKKSDDFRIYAALFDQIRVGNPIYICGIIDQEVVIKCSASLDFQVMADPAYLELTNQIEFGKRELNRQFDQGDPHERSDLEQSLE